jgi:hypothetical protein
MHFKAVYLIKTPWTLSAIELYQRRDHHLSAKLVPVIEDRGCCVVSTTHPYCLFSDFLDGNRYIFFQAAPRLYSRGWMDPVPEPLLLRKSGSAGNRTQDLWICNQELCSLDDRDSLVYHINIILIIINTCYEIMWPPLWSSGQSSWLQIRRPGFDSRH